MNNPILRVDNLHTHFAVQSGGVARAVDGVSFDVNAGETVCIVGESGCGKSVCAFSIMQLLPPTAYHPQGRVLFDEHDILQMSVEARRAVRGRQISIIFQEPGASLNPVQTVGAQVAEIIRLHEKVSRKEAYKRVVALFEEVGIPQPEARYKAYPHEMSGGMKQRVMISMALACNPKLLIADEPTTALDVTISAQILNLLKRIQSERDMSVLMITHNLREVNQVADRVIVMYAGKIVEVASRKELFANPLHPYTQALLGAIPGEEKRGEKLAEISGIVPPATAFPDYCRFENRCAHAGDKCIIAHPALVAVESAHFVACVLFERGNS